MSQLRQVHGLGEETARSICDWENRVDLVGELQRIQQHPCQWITLEDPNYPQALREIYDPPSVLHVQGSSMRSSCAIQAGIGRPERR